MEDEKIVSLFWARNEAALTEASIKYGAYCTAVAMNILHNVADAEECVNDTWLRAWEAIPPHRPLVLGSFLGKITRNLSFDLYKRLSRVRRGGGALHEVLDELGDCVSGGVSAEAQWEAKELVQEINRFLHTLSGEKQYIFVLRYWYAESIAEIADRLGISENKVSVTLSRIRSGLKAWLTERGFCI